MQLTFSKEATGLGLDYCRDILLVKFYVQITLGSECARPSCLVAAPARVRFKTWPLFHPRYNPNMQESDLEKTHQGLNLAVLTLEEFHAKPQFLYLFGKSNTDTTEMWKRANESI